MTGRNVHGAADINRAIAIAGEIARSQNAGRHAGSEQVAVPDRMIPVGNRSWICATENGCDAVLYCLKRLPVAARREGVTMSLVTRNLVGVPLARAHPLNQIGTHLVTLDRER